MASSTCDILTQLQLSSKEEDLDRVIKTVLQETLNTVKFSCNLQKDSQGEMKETQISQSLFLLSGALDWAWFLLFRTFSHKTIGDQYLVSTYLKSGIDKKWEPALKLVKQQCRILAIDEEVVHDFNTNLTLDECHFIKLVLQAKSGRAGNCGILSAYFTYALWIHALERNRDLIKKIEFVTFENIDHSFVLLNRSEASQLGDHKNWECKIIDPWLLRQGKKAIYSSQGYNQYVDYICHERPDLISSKKGNKLAVSVEFSVDNIPESRAYCAQINRHVQSIQLESVADDDSSFQAKEVHQVQFEPVVRTLNHCLHSEDNLQPSLFKSHKPNLDNDDPLVTVSFDKRKCR